MLICALFMLLPFTAAAQQDFMQLHRDAVVVDGHNDVLGRIMRGGDMESRGSRGHSDLPRFAAGGLDVQVFSIWVPSRERGDNAWHFALAEIDSLKAIAGRNPGRLRVVTDAGQLRHAVNEGLIAGIIGLEGGRCIDGRRDRILTLHERGMRSFGLTWNYSSDWATCSKDEAAGKVSGGLSAKGRRFVRLLDSLGVLIDVSHLGERSFWDVLETTRHPIFASHSACSALRNHHRNLTDRQLRALADNGGVIMINFYPGFLVSNLNRSRRNLVERMHVRHAELTREHPQGGSAYLAAVDKLLQEAEKRGLPSLYTIADHIDHVVQVAGIDHVGLGSDFDGISLTPVGLRDVTDLPLLTRVLRHRGYSDEDIRKILGGNFLRIFSEVAGN